MGVHPAMLPAIAIRSPALRGVVPAGFKPLPASARAFDRSDAPLGRLLGALTGWLSPPDAGSTGACSRSPQLAEAEPPRRSES